MKAKRTIWGKRWLSALASLILGLVAMLGFMLALSGSLGGDTLTTWAQEPTETLKPPQGPRGHWHPEPWGKPVSPPRPEISQPEVPKPPWADFNRWGPRPGGLVPPTVGGGPGPHGLRALSASPAITVSLTLDSFWGYTAPSATLTATLKSGATFKGLAVAIVDGLGWFGDIGSFFDQGKAVDIAGGDTVEFFINGVKTTVTLPTITGGIDPATDVVSGTISGVSLPTNVTILTHSRSRTVATDASGNFSTDWTGIADIVQDDRVDVAYEMTSGYWAMASFYPQNGFTVYETWDRVWGYTTPGDTVTVTIRSITGTLKESGTATAQIQWGGGWWYGAGVDIAAGDQVEVEVGGDTITTTVSAITAVVDLAADTVSGIGPANSSLWINFSRQEGTASRLLEQTVSTASDGSYSADFSAEGIGRWEGSGYVIHTDNLRADTALFFWALYAVVDQTYNDAVGRANVGASIAITLTDSGGAVKDVQVPSADPYNGYYQATFVGDVVPGDTVQVMGGGISATIPITTLTAIADRVTDVISGQAPPNSSHLRVGQWGEYSPYYEQEGFTSDASGSYTADLSGEVDVHNRGAGELYYHTDDDLDEHLQSVAYRTPDYHVSLTWDNIEGHTGIPNLPITLTLLAADGVVKGTNVVVGQEPDGRINWADFYADGEKQDVVPGDQVIVETLAFSDTIPIVGFDVTIDPATDVVYGIGPVDTRLRIWIDWLWPNLEIPTDGEGRFMADFSGIQDIQATSWAHIVYTDPDFNLVGYSSSPPYLRIRVNQTHDWVDACCGTPGATVWVTVTDSLGGLKGTAQATTGGNGCTGFTWSEPHPDIVVGDRVDALSSDGITATATVITITGQVDAEANTLSGQVLGVPYPATMRGEIWEEGAPSPETQTDAQGYFTLDFSPFDIRPGMDVAAWYIQPDGNWVGAVFRELVPELSINKWNTSGHARPDGVVVYGISYSNNGNGVAEDTLIVDTLPPNTTWAGDTSGVVPDIGAGGVITWNLGDLDPGDESAFMVTLDVSGLSDGDTIDQNCVVITTTTPGDYDLGNNDSCAGSVDVWDDEVEIDVDKWPNPDDPTPGQEFNYTVRWCNNRGAAAGPVWLTDTLPLSTTLVSWSPERWRELFWTEVAATGGQLVLYAPGLPGDMCEHLNLTLLLDADVPISTTLENTVVIATAGDVDPDNNERINTDAHVSEPCYDMRLDKRVHQNVPVPGGWIEYFFDYANDGNMATHIWITDTMPGGLSYDSAHWGGGQPQEGEPFPDPTIIGNQLVWDLGVVPADDAAWFHVQMNIADTLSPGDVITNCATVGIDGDESTPEDNTSCYPVTLNQNGPNLRVTKSHDWHGDGQLGYEIRFENIGDQTVSDVWITDTLPADTTWDGWWDMDFDWDRLVSDTQSGDMLRWQFSDLYPGDYGWLYFNADLDEPGTRFRWYTNTVEIETPPGDTNPDDNIYEDVAFSGGEVDWVDLDVYGTHIWGCGYSDPVTVTTAHEQRVYGGNCWNDDFSDPFEPGDVVTIEAGAATHPVVIHVPDPFSAQADSATDEVWGQIDALDHEWVEVDLYGDGTENVQTDGSGNFSATFPDIPRGGSGEVRYNTEIDYANVVFHRRFQAPDLVITVDYEHDWVDGDYEAGHTVWITVTESDGFTVKATATVSPTPGGDWSTEGWHWLPSQPDIAPGDWVYGLVNSAYYTTTVHVGTINAEVDVDADTVAGTIHAPWLAPDLVTVHCEIHEENGPGIRVDNVDPDGGSFFCDFSGMWDIRPGHNVAVNYREPDRDRVQTHPPNPVPDLRVEKWGEGEPVSGRTYDWTLRYRNQGDAPAEGVALVDTLPEGMTFVSDSTGTAIVVGNQVIWGLGTVEPGDWITITLTVQVDAEPCNEVENCAEISTTSWERDTGNNSACFEGHVEADEVDLGVGKWASAGDPAPGHEYVYHIDYWNGRPASALNVRITDTLPVSTTFVSEWHPPGWSVDTSTPGVVVWTRAELPGHRGGYLELKMRVNDDVPYDTQLWNRVKIGSDTYDVDPDNNWQEHDVWTSNPRMNMHVGKWYSHGSPVAGQENTCWVQMENWGNVTAHDAVLTDTLPADATFVSAARYDWNPATGDYDLESDFPPDAQGPGWARWELGELVTWRRVQMRVTFRIGDDVPVGTELVNRAEVASSEPETYPEDNVAEYTFTTQAPGPNVRAFKYFNWGDVAPGKTIEYWLHFDNDGTEPAENVVFTDTLPAYVTYEGHGFWKDPTIVDNQLVWEVGTMNPGDAHGFWVQVRINDDAPAGAILTNTVEIATTSPESRYDDNLAQVVRVVGPDLRVEKELLDEVLPGRQVRYRIRIWNEGHAHAHNVVLTDTLPAGCTYAWDWWDGEVQDGVVVWRLGDLHPGWNGDFEIGVDVGRDIPGGMVIANTLDIAGDEDDANPDDNHFELASTVESPYWIQVQESHNWVAGRVLPDAYVNVTLRDSGGVEKETINTGADGDGNFQANFGEDIAPGDTVEVDTEGTPLIVIEVIRIEGAVDADANTISGHVYDVAYPADLRGEVWVEDGPSVEDQTDEFGDYTVDFSPFDLKSGHDVALWYVRPDGHEVGIVRSGLFVRVYPTDDHVWGQTVPNTVVDVSLRDGEGRLKGTAQVTSDDNGDWWTEVYTDTQRVEIDDRDTVEVTAGANSASVYVPGIMPLPDAVHDSLVIVSELPNTRLEIRWDSQPDMEDHDLANSAEVTTDEYGFAALGFAPLGGLELGVHGNLYYYDADGNCVEPWWRAMIASVAPNGFVNDTDHTIFIAGAGFQPTPEAVLLGEGWAPPSIALPDVTYILNSLLQVTVPAGTPAGVYYVQVPNPDERIGFLAEALTIKNPEPTLAAIEPNYAHWDGPVSFILTGADFVEGAEVWLEHSEYITATEVTVISPTQITGTLDVTGASVGLWDVVVRNPGPGEPTGVLEDGFTVAYPVPELTAIEPDSEANDGSVEVVVYGDNFIGGATLKLVKDSAVITATGVVVTDTQISGNLDLTGAEVGAWDVVVVNPGPLSPTGHLPAGFTVQNPEPTVTAIEPDYAHWDGSVSFILTGADFVEGAEVWLEHSEYITATGVTVVSPTQITGTLDVSGASVGLWDVVVRNPGPGEPTGVLEDGFTVAYPIPTVTGIAPAEAPNDAPVSVVISGTNFVDGAVVRLEMDGAVITATGVVVTDTQISGNLDLTGVAVGAWDVVVVNPGPLSPTGTLPEAFTIRYPTPVVLGITPNNGPNDGHITVTISGTNFVDGAAVRLEMDSAAITGTAVIVISPAHINATFDLTDAAVGAYDVVVTNPGPLEPTGRLPEGFTVQNPEPTVTAINPDYAHWDGPVSFILTGTDFVEGAEVWLEHSEYITATGVTVVSPTQITGTLDVSGASVGLWDVVVRNPGPGEPTGVLEDGFTVAYPIPIVTGIAPAEAPNDAPVSVVISGTNFVDGAVVRLEMDGAVITATGVVVTDTQISGNLDLTGVAVGAWDVVVVNPGPLSPTGVLEGGFTVKAVYKIYLPLVLRNHS